LRFRSASVLSAKRRSPQRGSGAGLDRPERRPCSSFDIDMAALIAERGADYSIIRMAPVPCPRCGSRDTETRLRTPPHRDTTWLSDGDLAYPR
jgi:hypothetical protein